MITGSTTPRKRRWRVVLIILLLVAAGWLTWRWLNPRLAPITARHYPGAYVTYSANGYGYPVILNVPSVEYGADIRDYHRLDDRGNTLSAMDYHGGETAVSPTRQVLAWYDIDPKTDKPVVMRAWKDGHISRTPRTADSHVMPAHVSDDGMTSEFRSTPHCQTADGHIITPALPKSALPWTTADDVESLDPDLLPLCRNGDPNLYIYDLSRKRMAAKFPGFASYYLGSNWARYAASIVMRHGMHIAAIPHMGRAMVWDGKAVTALPRGFGSIWYWGEDGTVWTYTDKGPELLQWRQGVPRLIPLPFKAKFDGRIGIEYNSVREIAVWGDGQLVVHTEVRTVLPGVVERGMNAVYTRLKRPKPQLKEIWQLTLYRGNRLHGSFRVPLHPIKGDAWYSEHLAFTADGKYLSWVIDNGDGTHLYVFPTGR